MVHDRIVYTLQADRYQAGASLLHLRTKAFGASKVAGDLMPEAPPGE